MARDHDLHFGIGLNQLLPMEESVRLAQLAEGAGFERVSCADNLFMRPVWPILTLVAEHTRRVEVGPLVTHPFLTHPAVIAGYVAELDEVSRGRAFIGIGRGAFYDQLAFTPPKPLTAVREAIEIIIRLLRGDRSGYRGEVFGLAEGAALRWQPTRRELPIVVGSWGPKLSEMAGELADEVDVGFLLNLEHIRVVRDHLHAGARRARRDPGRLTVACGSITSVAPDRRDALALARHHLSLFLPVLSRLPGYPKVDPAEVEAVERALRSGGPEEAARHITDATTEAFCLVGTPEDALRRIGELAAAGVRHVTFCPPFGPDRDEAIQLLGKKVAARFRGG